MPTEHMVAILSVSSAHAAATTALVDGIAGMMFFTTPCTPYTHASGPVSSESSAGASCVSPVLSPSLHLPGQPTSLVSLSLHSTRAKESKGRGTRHRGSHLRVLQRNAWDTELLGARGRLFEHPLHVLGVVGVECFVAAHRAPMDQVRPLDAVRGAARRLRQRTQRERRLQQQGSQCKVEVGGR